MRYILSDLHVVIFVLQEVIQWEPGCLKRFVSQVWCFWVLEDSLWLLSSDTILKMHVVCCFWGKCVEEFVMTYSMSQHTTTRGFFYANGRKLSSSLIGFNRDHINSPWYLPQQSTMVLFLISLALWLFCPLEHFWFKVAPDTFVPIRIIELLFYSSGIPISPMVASLTIMGFPMNELNIWHFW